MSELFVFGWIGSHQVAFEARHVEVVIDIAMVVPVPLAPAHVIGLAAIRSQVITVIDCCVATGGSGVAPTGRAVVVMIDGHRYGLRVDRVEDVAPGALLPLAGAALIGPAWRAVAMGIVARGDSFAIALNPARLVAPAPVSIAA